jgi:tetratricopeptide (TPR) repeat protein
MQLGKGAILLDRAIEVALQDPRAGLILAREATRLNRFVRCLRVRSLGLMGNIYSSLGDFRIAERLLLSAHDIAEGCQDCDVVLDRYTAVLLSKQGRHAEARRHADRAVEGALGEEEKTLSLLYRAFIHFDGENFSSAASDERQVLMSLSPDSPYYSVALITLGAALCQDGAKEEDLREAQKLIPRLRETLKGVRGVSTVRAYRFWLEGGVAQALARLATGKARRELERVARRRLRGAVRQLAALDLPEAHAAAFADLTALEASIGRGRVGLAERLTRKDIPRPSGRFHELVDSILKCLPSEPLPLEPLRQLTGFPPLVPNPA